MEKQLKGWSRAKKIALTRSDWKLIQELAECSNQTAARLYSPVSSFDSAQDDTGVVRAGGYSSEVTGASVVLPGG